MNLKEMQNSNINNEFPWEDFVKSDVVVYLNSDNDRDVFLRQCDLNGINVNYSVICNKSNKVWCASYVVYEVDCDLINSDKYYWSEKRYEKSIKIWTDLEIEYAKRISNDLILKLFKNGKDIWFWVYPEDNSINCILSCKNICLKSIFESPKGNDLFNEDIGKCVCLCKVTNTKIPYFIVEKNK